MAKKTFKNWEKSQLDVEDYLGEHPCEVDEKLYNSIVESVGSSVHDEKSGLVQAGDCFDIITGIEYYCTLKVVNTENGYVYWWLGVLPLFTQSPC